MLFGLILVEIDMLHLLKKLICPYFPIVSSLCITHALHLPLYSLLLFSHQGNEPLTVQHLQHVYWQNDCGSTFSFQTNVTKGLIPFCHQEILKRVICMDKIQFRIRFKKKAACLSLQGWHSHITRPVFVLSRLVLILSEIRWAHMNPWPKRLGHVDSNFICGQLPGCSDATQSSPVFAASVVCRLVLAPFWTGFKEMSQKHMAGRVKKEGEKSDCSFQTDIMLEKTILQVIPQCKKELKKWINVWPTDVSL